MEAPDFPVGCGEVGTQVLPGEIRLRPQLRRRLDRGHSLEAQLSLPTLEGERGREDRRQRLHGNVVDAFVHRVLRLGCHDAGVAPDWEGRSKGTAR